MKYLLLSLSMLCCIASFTQNHNTPTTKFGKGIEENFKQSFQGLVQDDDTAVQIFNTGTYGYEFYDDYITFNRTYHKRIKVINGEGKKFADVTLQFNNDTQEVKHIKAVSYNKEQGKIVETKLKKSDILKSGKSSDDVVTLSFAVPNVREGSVFEYTYTVSTKNSGVAPNWYFDHREMPTYYSELLFHVPKFATYHFTSTVALDINDENLTTVTKPRMSYGVNSKTMAKFNSQKSNDEDFVANINDYRPYVKFALSKIELEGSIPTIYDTTWENINKTLLVDHYNKYLNKDGKSEKIIQELLTGITNKEEQLKTIFDYVNDNFYREDEGWIYPNQSLNQLEKNKKGNTTAINLFLTQLLQTAGFNARPMLISKRSEGYINQSYADKKELSYAVCYVIFNDKKLVLNAAKTNTPYNLAHYEDYNYVGWIVDEKSPKWGTIEYLAPSSTRLFHINGSLKEDGSIDGELTVTFSNYFKQRAENKIKDDGLEEYLQMLYEDDETTGQLTISEEEVIGSNDKYEKLIVKTKVNIDGDAQVVNDFIYFNPYLFERLMSNPFNEENRSYPVDVRFPYTTKVILTLNLPEGYKTEEVPKPIILKFSDDVNVKYLIKENNNKLVVNITEKMHQTIYTPNEYKPLKDYMDKLVELSGRQLVIKKM